MRCSTRAAEPVASKNRLLTTVAYQLGGKRTYALEGAIFIAGAAVQWLRDGLRIIESAKESNRLAAAADPGQDVYLVPAFVGLGAPYWQPEARGALFGLTRGSGPNELARAALEAVCYQTRDLLEAMRGDWSADAKSVLRVDGGMVASDWTMQFLADMLDAPVERPTILETTALGAAWLAGHRPACGRTRRASPSCGSSSVRSSRRSPRRSVSASTPAGSARCVPCCSTRTDEHRGSSGRG